MTYSHRDHRVFRDVYRLLGGVLAGSVALIAVALLAPWAAVGVLAVLGLAIAGGVALRTSDRLVEGYVGDLRSVDLGDAISPLLRVEVESRIELERPVFVGARRSPNARPGPAGAAPVAEPV